MEKLRATAILGRAGAETGGLGGEGAKKGLSAPGTDWGRVGTVTEWEFSVLFCMNTMCLSFPYVLHG